MFLNLARFGVQNTLGLILDQNIFSTLFSIKTILTGLIEQANVDKCSKINTVSVILEDSKPIHFNINKQFFLLENSSPFGKVIYQLKQLCKKKTPTLMFQHLAKIKEEICKAVDKSFEANFPELYGKEQIKIDPDNLILILIYCMLKAKEPMLYVSQLMMQEHVNPNISDVFFFQSF